MNTIRQNLSYKQNKSLKELSNKPENLIIGVFIFLFSLYFPSLLTTLLCKVSDHVRSDHGVFRGLHPGLFFMVRSGPGSGFFLKF